MLCLNCGEREAQINITQIVNNQKTEIHLCPQCAQLKGQADHVFALHKMLTGLVDWESGAPARGRACPGCGLTEHELRQSGRLGCEQCYQTWEPLIRTILSRVHGRLEHSGKIPVGAQEGLRLSQRLRGLREALDKSVRAENFEEAARLRDEIRMLQSREG